MSERLQYVIRKRGYSSDHQWGLDAGLAKSTVGLLLNGSRGKNTRRSTFQALARVANVSWTWLREGTGKWEPYEGPPAEETSPAPPSAIIRMHQEPDNDVIPDEIEELALELVRRKGAPKYTYQELKAAKLFVHRAASRLRPGFTRLDLLASAAEAARDLTAAGENPTPDGILEVLLSKNTPKYAAPPPEQETSFQKRLREAREANEREGTTLSRPLKPVDATTSKSPKTS